MTDQIFRKWVIDFPATYFARWPMNLDLVYSMTLTQTQRGYPPPVEHVGLSQVVKEEKGERGRFFCFCFVVLGPLLWFCRGMWWIKNVLFIDNVTNFYFEINIFSIIILFLLLCKLGMRLWYFFYRNLIIENIKCIIVVCKI